MTQLLGIDLGTTTFKAVVYDEGGNALASGRVSPPDEATSVDGVRVDYWGAESLWERFAELTRATVDQLANPTIDALTIDEIGLVGFPLDREGLPLYHAVTWIEPHPELSAVLDACGIANDDVFAITGNSLNPIYPPAWISWLSDHLPEYGARMARWAYYGDYLAYLLTGELAVDLSMASQTITLDQSTLAYSPTMFEAFGFTKGLFPDARPAGTLLGHVTPTAAEKTGLPAGTPVVLGGADALCGPYGAGFVDAGDAAVNTGTWECVIVCADAPQLEPALPRVGAICDPHVVRDRWTVRIENLIGGATEWFRREIAHFNEGVPAESEETWRVLEQRATEASPGADGVVFYPYVFGSYGPRLDELARGALAGLRNTTNQSHLARALYEGLNFHTRHALESMTDATGLTPDRVVCMGGGAKNSFWMQNRADVLGRAIDVVDHPDVTPRGAAMIAGVGVGVFEGFADAARRFAPPSRTLEPDPALTGLYTDLYENVFLPLENALVPVNHALAAHKTQTAESPGLPA